MLDTRTTHSKHCVFGFESANAERVLKPFEPALRVARVSFNDGKIEDLHTTALTDLHDIRAVFREFDAEYSICHNVSVLKVSRSFDRAADKWPARPSER